MNDSYLIGDPATLSRTFILLSIAFFTVAIFVVLFILVSRIIKSSKLKRETALLSVLQPSLNGLLFQEGDIPEASYEFNLAEIRKILRSEPLAPQVFINHIVGLKKSITGSSAKVLDKIYHDLRLHEISKRKLSLWSWNLRAQGIRELSELNSNEALRLIPALASTRNKTLKEEVLLSTIRLNKNNPLDFLDQWDGEITSWMRIHIHRYLSHTDARTLPDFSKWFSSDREDVVVFAISMAQQFQQSSSTAGLAKLLAHNNPAIVTSAIVALTELEAFEFADDVLSIADRFWDNETISQSIVQYLGKTGHSKDHFKLLERYLAHNVQAVRLEAVRALITLGDEGQSILDQFRNTTSNGIPALIAHASEPLLR